MVSNYHSPLISFDKVNISFQAVKKISLENIQHSPRHIRKSNCDLSIFATLSLCQNIDTDKGLLTCKPLTCKTTAAEENIQYKVFIYLIEILKIFTTQGSPYFTPGRTANISNRMLAAVYAVRPVVSYCGETYKVKYIICTIIDLMIYQF